MYSLLESRLRKIQRMRGGHSRNRKKRNIQKVILGVGQVRRI